MVKTIISSKRRLIPIAMTIINPLREVCQTGDSNEQPPVLKSWKLPAESINPDQSMHLDQNFLLSDNFLHVTGELKSKRRKRWCGIC